jgi:hypothetical protein
MNKTIERLLASDEPSIRYKVRARLLRKQLTTAERKQYQEEIRTSQRVERLLSERDADGRIQCHPYKKWYGAHWVLATLADNGYPAADQSLVPLREEVLTWLLSKEHERYIRTVNGRVRRCASQEGNALYAILTLGLADYRTDQLADRLMRWQWSDGGWNCDKIPQACNSSFMETLIPLRAIALYAERTGDTRARRTAEEAANVFLKRRLFKRQRDGSVMDDDFTRLHYPCYWHYDVLFGLKVMAETGFLDDRRCCDALDLLESKQLPDGSFPAEAKYYRVTEKGITGRSLVAWGPTGKKRGNEFVTADSLYVLKQAGRWCC